MKSIKKVLAAFLALALVLTSALFVPEITEAKAKKPTIDATASVEEGSTATLTITNGKFKVKKIKSVASSDEAVATAAAEGKKTVVVTGVKEGKATITTTVKAKKGKKSKNFKLATEVTVTAKATPEPTPVEPVVASTQAEVDAALATFGLQSLTIKTDEAVNFTLTGDHKDVELTINAPKSDVTNDGTWKLITIEAIKANTFTEKAKGNFFKILAKVSNLVAAQGAQIAGIDVAVPASSAGGLFTFTAQAGATADKIDVNTNAVKTEAKAEGEGAKIGELNLNAAGAQASATAESGASIDGVTVAKEAEGAALDLFANGTGEIKGLTVAAPQTDVLLDGDALAPTKVTVSEGADGSKISADKLVDVENSAGEAKVVLFAGAKDSTVATTSETAKTVTENQTGGDVKTTDAAGTETTVATGQTGTTDATGTTSEATANPETKPEPIPEPEPEPQPEPEPEPEPEPQPENPGAVVTPTTPAQAALAGTFAVTSPYPGEMRLAYTPATGEEIYRSEIEFAYTDGSDPTESTYWYEGEWNDEEIVCWINGGYGKSKAFVRRVAGDGKDAGDPLTAEVTVALVTTAAQANYLLDDYGTSYIVVGPNTTFEENVSLGGGDELFIPEKSDLTLNSGVTLSNAGVVVIEGALTATSATFTNTGEVYDYGTTTGMPYSAYALSKGFHGSDLTGETATAAGTVNAGWDIDFSAVIWKGETITFNCALAGTYEGTSSDATKVLTAGSFTGENWEKPIVLTYEYSNTGTVRNTVNGKYSNTYSASASDGNTWIIAHDKTGKIAGTDAPAGHVYSEVVYSAGSFDGYTFLYDVDLTGLSY